MTRKKVFHHALMAAMHRRAVHNRGGPGRCRDWSSRFPRAGEPLPRFFSGTVCLWPIRHLFMLSDFWSWSKRGKSSEWHLDEIPLNLYTLQCWKTREGIDFRRMPLALCARAATKATFKWHARTRLCATQIIKLRLSLLSLLSLPFPPSPSLFLYHRLSQFQGSMPLHIKM